MQALQLSKCSATARRNVVYLAGLVLTLLDAEREVLEAGSEEGGGSDGGGGDGASFVHVASASRLVLTNPDGGGGGGGAHAALLSARATPSPSFVVDRTHDLFRAATPRSGDGSLIDGGPPTPTPPLRPRPRGAPGRAPVLQRPPSPSDGGGVALRWGDRFVRTARAALRAAIADCGPASAISCGLPAVLAAAPSLVSALADSGLRADVHTSYELRRVLLTRLDGAVESLAGTMPPIVYTDYVLKASGVTAALADGSIAARVAGVVPVGVSCPPPPPAAASPSATLAGSATALVSSVATTAVDVITSAGGALLRRALVAIGAAQGDGGAAPSLSHGDAGAGGLAILPAAPDIPLAPATETLYVRELVMASLLLRRLLDEASAAGAFGRLTREQAAALRGPVTRVAAQVTNALASRLGALATPAAAAMRRAGEAWARNPLAVVFFDTQVPRPLAAAGGGGRGGGGGGGGGGCGGGGAVAVRARARSPSDPAACALRAMYAAVGEAAAMCAAPGVRSELRVAMVERAALLAYDAQQDAARGSFGVVGIAGVLAV